MTKSFGVKGSLNIYSSLLTQIKQRIRVAQARAVMSANAEMISMYWDIGKMLDARQKEKGWGAGIVPKLSMDIRNDIPEVKGFSERNMGRMIAFFKTYSDIGIILPQPVAKLPPSVKVPQPVAQLAKSSVLPRTVAKLNEQQRYLILTTPWGHHAALIEKIKDQHIRFWYMQQLIEHGWGRDKLIEMIKSSVHKRQGKVTSNFKTLLPAPQSELVQQTLKDPYIFDFMTMEEPFHERELETNLIRHLEKFLIELGQGFAFVGRQYHVDVAGHDFYIDLLFYHLKLRAYVVIELKRGPFKPEYTGKMNFYCSIVDDKIRTAVDNPTIGLILCQDRDRVLAEYALRDVKKPIGVSEYLLTQNLPAKLKSALPSIQQLEAELSFSTKANTKKRKRISK